MNEFIDARTFEQSSNEVITELHETIVTLRARILTLEKQQEKFKLDKINFDKTKSAFENGMKRMNDVDDEILHLRQVIEYYEENLDLIWKRRKRPKAVIEGKEEAFKKYVPFKGRFKQNQVIAHLNVIRNYYEDKLKENENYKNKYLEVKELNDNIEIPESMKKDIEQRFTKLEAELKTAYLDIEYYKKFAPRDKVIERKKVTGKRVPLSSR